MESSKSSTIMEHLTTMKVEIPSDQEDQSAAPGPGTGGLARQPSVPKSNCLCSPTTHAGSFRCRLHRAPSLQRTKSIDALPSAPTAKPNVTHS